MNVAVAVSSKSDALSRVSDDTILVPVYLGKLFIEAIFTIDYVEFFLLDRDTEDMETLLEDFLNKSVVGENCLIFNLEKKNDDGFFIMYFSTKKNGILGSTFANVEEVVELINQATYDILDIEHR